MSPGTTRPRNEVFDRELVRSILDKMGRDDRYTTREMATLTFEQLYSQLNQPEIEVVKQLLALSPEKLGFLGPFVSLEGPPKNLVKLEGQVFERDGKKVTIANQYLPQPVWQAFLEMQEATKQDIGSKLMVESGYRSPAHQSITFLTYLEKSDFDIKYVVSGVALPGYSQHGDPVNTAVDVINQDGIPTDEKPQLFANTNEYQWLIKNAKQFDFYLSYPEGNEFDVKFEPWHWQYRKTE
ncbi:MAG: D-alanyl-D-alanine carboxypeptidase family protein [Candidatus Saccharimonadales bacterium]|jgi:LAS superfamily LD-carboxypeptidase LdcB